MTDSPRTLPGGWRFLLLLMVAGLLLTQCRDRHQAPTPAEAAGSSSPTAVTRTGSNETRDTPPAPGDDRAESDVGAGEQYGPVSDPHALQRAAGKFATEFARPGTDWPERVGKLCVPTLARRLATVDPANLPETGPLTSVRIINSSEPISQAEARYAAGMRIEITLIYEPVAGWQVLTYERRDTR